MGFLGNLLNNSQRESKQFQFEKLPSNVNELTALPEASLDSPYKTAALTVAALCAYAEDPEKMFEMLDFLEGPETVSVYQKQFLSERLKGKTYKPFSFFEGASVDNGYTPSVPYRISIVSTPHSFPEENWAFMYVQSSGADDLRAIKLRKKPSTGQWFLNEVQCLSDIRIPASEDPWA